MSEKQPRFFYKETSSGNRINLEDKSLEVSQFFAQMPQIRGQKVETPKQS